MTMDHGPERKELKAQWKTEVEVPTMTLSDVTSHKTKESLWIVIHDKVYDVTQYAKDHPGGRDVLDEVGGKDATSDYEAVGHSEDAREIMHPFLVGVLPHKESTPASRPSVQVVRRGPPKQEEAGNVGTQLMRHLHMTPQVELGALTVSALALVWYLQNTRSLPASPDQANDHIPPHSFVHGFALASAVGSVVAAAGIRYASKQLEMGPKFSSYPARIPLANSLSIEHQPRGVLLPSEYTKFRLVRKDELAKDIFRFVFALPTETSILGLPTGQHVAIRGYWEDESGHHTVVRSYTPVSNNSDLGRLELLIRCYPDGQLTGKYLPNVKIGDAVEFRGPTGMMKYRKGLSRQLGMVAGGTGITPMYQLIRAICEDKTDNTQVSLIYANRSESDILLRKQLDRFASLGKLAVHYVLDKPPQGWKGGKGFVTKEMMQEYLPAVSDDTKMLLCGPPGMVNAAKKGLVELGCRAPGAVSKMSDQIFCF